MLDKNSPLPLYHQLKKVIEERIDSQEWTPGMRLPSERELCDQFQVSRITVRQALAELVNAGGLTRQQGVGTFVASPRIEQNLTHLVGFTQDMQARGKRPGSRIIEQKALPAPPHIARALQIQPGDSMVMLKRLRLTDGEPMAIEIAYLPDAICNGLLAEDMHDRSLYQLLMTKYNVFPSRAEQQLQAIACPAAEAQLLGIAKGSPVLHIYRLTFTAEARPVEYTESYYRGDRYVFQVELST
jgi:GntR family transcriptional regulator